jgi:outer membrane murein-binding lipoprotein Lpp
MANLIAALKLLEQERNRLASQLERLNGAISALNVNGAAGRRRIAAAGRAPIAAAQRVRWAKPKGKKVVVLSARKRSMSLSARKRIAAGQKTRWAKWRKVHDRKSA